MLMFRQHRLLAVILISIFLRSTFQIRIIANASPANHVEMRLDFRAPAALPMERLRPFNRSADYYTRVTKRDA